MHLRGMKQDRPCVYLLEANFPWRGCLEPFCFALVPSLIYIFKLIRLWTLTVNYYKYRNGICIDD